MIPSTDFSRRMIDRAIAIKRTLAIRSRLQTFCHTLVRKAKRRLICTRLGWESARDYLMDRKYGGWCGRVVPPPHPDLHARQTQSTHYWQLARIFQEVPIKESDYLVEVGCGYGRVINYWLSTGCTNRILGIELNERVAECTRERLKPYHNVTIVTGNALDHVPPDANLFFLFNPFGEPVMERFKALLQDTSRQRRDLRMVYHNCLHRNLFDSDPNWEVQELRSRVCWKTILLRAKGWDQGA